MKLFFLALLLMFVKNVLAERWEMYVWRMEYQVFGIINSVFGARINYIGDSCFNPKSKSNPFLQDNNRLAKEFVKEEMDSYDVFIVTIYKK